jgi:hypothetical protein
LIPLPLRKRLFTFLLSQKYADQATITFVRRTQPSEAASAIFDPIKGPFGQINCRMILRDCLIILTRRKIDIAQQFTAPQRKKLVLAVMEQFHDGGQSSQCPLRVPAL